MQDSVILFRESHPTVIYELASARAAGDGVLRPPPAHAGAHQPRQERDRGASRRAAESAETGWQGRVDVRLRHERRHASPSRSSTTAPACRSTTARACSEPYVTTKGHKGTGLGLAIVQKITEQHGGELVLDDAPLGARPHARRARHDHTSR